MPDSDHNETGQVTNLPRRTMSLSPAKQTGAPNMKRLSRYNLLDLRLYAGGMNIRVPDDSKEEDVLKLIKQKADHKLKKTIPKFNRAALLAGATGRVGLPDSEATSQAESSSHGTSNKSATTEGQKASYSSEESGETSRGGEKDSGHGTTHSSATEEAEIEEVPKPKKQTKRVSFSGVPDTESEETPSGSNDEQDAKNDVGPINHLEAAELKLTWLESMSQFFSEEVTSNDQQLATIREQMHAAKLEAACIEAEIGKVDVMTENLEVEVGQHAGPEALAKYQRAIANAGFEDEEPAQAAGPSAESKEQPVVIRDTEESDDENEGLPLVPSSRAGQTVQKRTQVVPEAPTVAGKKRRRSNRSHEGFSDDSGDEGDDEGPVAKKMRLSTPSQDNDVAAAGPSHSTKNSGPRVTNRKVVPLPQRGPKSVAVSGSSKSKTSRTRTPDETASLSASAVQSRVNNDSESVKSARPKVGNRSATRAPQGPSGSNDMFSPANNVSSGGPSKPKGTTSTATGPSIPQPRRRLGVSDLIHSTAGRSSGTHSRQAADRAAADEVPVKTPTREVVRPKTTTQVRRSGPVSGLKAGKKGSTGPQ